MMPASQSPSRRISSFQRAARAAVGRAVRWGWLAAALLGAAGQAHAEYRLHVGDQIEISVARAPELKQRVPVQLDGSISFPMLGHLVVAGLTPADVQARIQAILATKVFRQRLSDGRENEIWIDHDEVTATVVEYRPIYVNGDVARPGEYAYRPLMTVRQAVAVSGGYELMRYRMLNPVIEAADLRAEYEALWIEFAKEQAHVWRLKAELGLDKDAKNFDHGSLTDLPLPKSTVADIVGVEAAQLQARRTDRDRQKAFLERAIAKSEEQIGILSEQQKEEEQGAQADVEELQRVVDLFGKGTLPSPRVVESRRAVLLSSTRKLQTTAELMQAKRQQDDFSRQVERLDDQRRIEVLQELQDANLKLGGIRAKLQSVAEKLQYVAMVRSQFVRASGEQPQIAVIRGGDKGAQRVLASEDTELQPGDVVDVTLRPGLAVESRSQ